MEIFHLYFTLGLTHVLDMNGLDHFYFISALTLPFGWKDRKNLVLWVSLFTLGHTLSLIGNYFVGWQFSSAWIEFLIPVTIAVSCWPVLKGQLPHQGVFMSFVTLGYGLIHGLGFGRYFAMMVQPEEAGWSLFSFAVGVEMAQFLIVGMVLLFLSMFNHLSRWQSWLRRIFGGVIFLMALLMIVERFPALLE